MPIRKPKQTEAKPINVTVDVDTDAESDGALIQLRALLAQSDSTPGKRLPAERTLCQTLGVTRNALRNALAVLESEGQIWRHVGRGTFIGPGGSSDAPHNTRLLSAKSNPPAVMDARLAMEPELARLAALHATSDDIEQMMLCLARSKAASDWRVYETWDNRLHSAIAEATHNALLIALFDTLNTVRRSVVWGRLRAARPCPAPNHHSHAEHLRIVQAIRDRDMHVARTQMHAHLESVRSKLISDTS